MIFNILLLVIWISACLIEGKRDAHYFSQRMLSTNPDKANIHWLFTAERFIIWIIITWIYSFTNTSFATGIFSTSLVFIFSFFHNSTYYEIRHRLDDSIYPKGWLDSSTTSESFLEFNLTARIFMAITGLIGIVATFTM